MPATPAPTASAALPLARVPLTEIGATVGTPCYVYDAPTIRAAFGSLDAAIDYPCEPKPIARFIGKLRRQAAKRCD